MGLLGVPVCLVGSLRVAGAFGCLAMLCLENQQTWWVEGILMGWWRSWVSFLAVPR